MVFSLAGSMKQFILLLAVLAQSAVGSSEKDKWTWPSTATADRTDRADRRKDLLFENIDNDNPSSRIRVPTSYDSINSGR